MTHATIISNNDIVERASFSKDPLTLLLRAERLAEEYVEKSGGCRTKAENVRAVRTLRNYIVAR